MTYVHSLPCTNKVGEHADILAEKLQRNKEYSDKEDIEK